MNFIEAMECAMNGGGVFRIDGETQVYRKSPEAPNVFIQVDSDGKQAAFLPSIGDWLAEWTDVE